MVKERVDAFAVAVDDVEDAVRHAGFGQQLAQSHRRQRHFFRGLQYERVTASERDREHPKRNHEREVVRRDADAHTNRVANGVGVDVGRDVRQHFAHDEAGDAAGEFDDFDAAVDFSPGFGKRFAVLARDESGQLFEVLFQQGAEAEHQPGPLDDRACYSTRVGPLRQRRLLGRFARRLRTARGRLLCRWRD